MLQVDQRCFSDPTVHSGKIKALELQLDQSPRITP